MRRWWEKTLWLTSRTSLPTYSDQACEKFSNMEKWYKQQTYMWFEDVRSESNCFSSSLLTAWDAAQKCEIHWRNRFPCSWSRWWTGWLGHWVPASTPSFWIRPLCFSHIQFPVLLARSNNSQKSTSERTISSSQPKNWYHSLSSYLAEHVRPFNSSNKFMGENLPTPSCLWWPYSFGYSWCLS